MAVPVVLQDPKALKRNQERRKRAKDGEKWFILRLILSYLGAVLMSDMKKCIFPEWLLSFRKYMSSDLDCRNLPLYYCFFKAIHP